jgi:hypothetical protein
MWLAAMLQQLQASEQLALCLIAGMAGERWLERIAIS